MKYARVSQLVRSAAWTVAFCGCLLGASEQASAADNDGFVSLFDGKTLAGWKANENTASWSVKDGAIICHGPRSHLFYVGADDSKPEQFKNFHLKAEVMTKPVANSGLFIHTAFQPEGWPAQGYEVQVNNSQQDPVRTGSLYNVVKNFTPPAKDNEWFTLEVLVKGKAVGVVVDGRVLFEFVEPEGVTGTRKLSEGMFALQAHDPGSEVHYRSIKVKRLP
ncbi:MAG: DUF1080 domain-containing protein [Planctomycetia bacterium]|nr:DUF1080 domain-containing protein [Planctomycetia bacterium]